jgi:Flp pilus assembly secretin CpaC
MEWKDLAMFRFRILKLLGIAGIAAPLLMAFLLPARGKEDLRQIFRVMQDEARPLRLDTPVQTLVIGNTAIAAASIYRGKTIIITGKSSGTTNLIALNRNNEIVAERQIRVASDSYEKLHDDYNLLNYNGKDPLLRNFLMSNAD